MLQVVLEGAGEDEERDRGGAAFVVGGLGQRGRGGEDLSVDGERVLISLARGGP
jgi:hypothetical protein